MTEPTFDDYDLDPVYAARTIAELRAEVARYRSFCGEALCGDIERDRDALQVRLEEFGGDATEWGEPKVEWTWGIRTPTGTAYLAPHMDQGDRSEEAVRAEFDAAVDSQGYRKALLCRTVGAWREAEPRYADKVNAPLSAETIVALRGEMKSGNYAKYRKRGE